MSQTSLRLRVVPRYPAKVTATDGLKAIRTGVDLVIKSDYSSLVQVPSVSNPDKTFLLAWDSDIDNYQSMSFTNIINNIQDAVIGPPLAAIDAANPGANQVVYFTDVGVASTFTASEFVRSISNAPDGPAFAAAIGAIQTDTANVFSKSQSISGPFALTSLGATSPANGVFMGAGGNSLSFQTRFSNPSGGVETDNQRGTLLVAATTSDDGNSEEQTFCVLTTIATGYASAWKVNTAYSLGVNVTNSGNVYRCITAGTSAVSGSGPTGKSASISDGSVVWQWINDAAILAKVGIYNEVMAIAGGGQAWAQANNFELFTGYNAPFAANTEFDLTNNSGTDAVIGSVNYYNVWINTKGTNKSTTSLAISSDNTANYAGFWGIRLNGDRLASNAIICVDASGAIGIGFGSGAGGVFNTTFSDSVIKDSSTAPRAIRLVGSYSSAAIEVPATTPAALSSSGSKTIAGIVELSTSPRGIQLAGTYSSASVEASGSSPTALSSTGSKTLAGIYEASTTPTGLYLNGTYTNFQIFGTNFSVLTNGTVTTRGLRSQFNPPASSTASGTQGDVAFDANYIYVCAASNSWKRAALSTF